MAVEASWNLYVLHKLGLLLEKVKRGLKVGFEHKGGGGATLRYSYSRMFLQPVPGQGPIFLAFSQLCSCMFCPHHHVVHPLSQLRVPPLLQE